MSSLGISSKVQFDLHWRGTLCDYVTAIAWSPQGKILAASSAAGEVALYSSLEKQIVKLLQLSDGESVDCLVFSRDGQFLAAGGQNGQVKI